MCSSFLHSINPLMDPRWNALVARHPRSSVFHTSAWLAALQRSYGCRPVVFTRSPPGVPLSDGVVFCSVTSWLTGNRLVSLPFSDHCEPLVDSESDLESLCATLDREVSRHRLAYFELRPQCPIESTGELFRSTRSFCFHNLDLTPDLGTIFEGFHKNCTQRKVHRAESSGLTYAVGRSPALLGAFYRLLVLTRRRHYVFPQPKAWFRNLISCFGDALKIRVASLHGQPVASILTLRHKNGLVYKYGGSDARYHSLGAVQYLFWQTIQEAKAEGCQVFDLGRSDLDQPGLLLFKDRLGAVRSSLTYSRFSHHPSSPEPSAGAPAWTSRVMRSGAVHLPYFMLPIIGRLVYSHLS